VRVIVLTCASRGFASYCLPALAVAPNVTVAAVIQAGTRPQRPWQRRWRKLKKAARLGVLGTLNGVHMRAWYDLSDRLKLEPLADLCARHNVPFHQTDSPFDPRTAELFRAASADLGLSLGNGYIPRRVFSVPRLGMINVHHELLPQFQGAQSVIWQLYHGSRKTGFTVHQIDDRIDTGAILAQQELDILFRPTLEETVRENYARLWEASRTALVDVVENYETRFASLARPQGSGRNFTTPTYWQFRRMVRMHEALRRHATGEAGAAPATATEPEPEPEPAEGRA
jgi:methionyl-tRNA formyltransferase